jgi:oligoendopeptidase F
MVVICEEHSMPGNESSHLWPAHDFTTLSADDLRRRCTTLITDCEARADAGETVFTGSPEEIAAALAGIGGLRATVLYWDGYCTAELAGGRNAAALHDLRLLIAEAVDAVDGLLQAAEAEWLTLSDSAAAKLLDEPVLRVYGNFLTGVRTLARYTLNDTAEAALAARDTAANTGWVELYYAVTKALRPVVDGRPVTLEQARSELERDDAALRERSLAAIYDALEPVAPVLSRSLDSLVADRLGVDAVRGLPHPRAERDLTNELPSSVVDDMLAVVAAHYELPQRWFARKATLLGLDRLDFAHMRAPIASGPSVPYQDAVLAVTEAFDGFSAEAGAMVRELIAGGHVDAEPRADKQPGAFCRSLGPGRPPRIVVSYFGTIEDVVALGHEFGHALHFTVAGRAQNGLTFDAPLALSEVAPAFTELLVQDWLIDHEPDPAVRGLLAAKRADTAIDAIFMSTFLTDFETRAHRLRAENNVLTDDRIRQLWTDCGRQFYGPAVELPPRWGLHWALVPHVTHERFYSYTYAFARLIGLNIYAAYRRDPAGFQPRLLDVLALGSSLGPAEQLALLDIDLTDRDTWYAGIAQFAELLAPLLADDGPTVESDAAQSAARNSTTG